MDKGTLILLIDEGSAGIDSIRRILAERPPHFRVQPVADVPTALARILGGGVDMVLLNLPAAARPAGAVLPTDSEVQRLLPFLTLRSQAQGVPIVVLCGSADENLAEAALREGAADYLIREVYDVDLLRVLHSVIAKARGAAIPLHPLASTGKSGRLLAFMGSTGGAGTSTVALNVAAALAADHRVILAEIHAELGTLAHYFQPHRSVRGLGDLFESAADAAALSPGEIENCLWPCKSIPGLQVLFGARQLESPFLLSPAKVRALLANLTAAADYVVVDLPVSLSAANREAIEDATLLALVVERDPLALAAAKLMLRALDSWQTGRVSLGTVIVNRSALVAPLPLADIEVQLAVPILGVIPPAADLCAAAQHAHIPLVALDADSLPALALRALSRTISQQVPLLRPGEQTRIPAPDHDMFRAGVR